MSGSSSLHHLSIPSCSWRAPKPGDGIIDSAVAGYCQRVEMGRGYMRAAGSGEAVTPSPRLAAAKLTTLWPPTDDLKKSVCGPRTACHRGCHRVAVEGCCCRMILGYPHETTVSP